LARLQTPGPKKVAIIGDSWAGYAGAQSRLDCGAGFIERAIKASFPDKPITVFPFAVGGSTWERWDGPMVAPGGAFPDQRYDYWFGHDYSRPLLDPVEAWAPDVVIMQFGMNDGGGFSIAGMRSVLAKIKAWTPRPDIVLATSPPPNSSYTDGANFRLYSSPEAQAGRDYVAGFMRSAAQVNGYGLLDFHRAFRAARDGYDCADYMLQSDTSFRGTKRVTPFSLPRSTADFAVRIGIATSPAAKAFADGNALNIQIGNNPGNILSLSLDGSTGGLLAAIDSATGHAFLPATLLAPWQQTPAGWVEDPVLLPATGMFSFNFTVCGPYVGLEFDGGRTWGARFEKYGGHFAPRFAMRHGNAQTIGFGLAAFGVARPQMPVITDDEAYGVSDASGPYRGSGVNHLSSHGWHRVVQPVIEAARWRA